jgi:hypothetical protein
VDVGRTWTAISQDAKRMDSMVSSIISISQYIGNKSPYKVDFDWQSRNRHFSQFHPKANLYVRHIPNRLYLSFKVRRERLAFNA